MKKNNFYKVIFVLFYALIFLRFANSESIYAESAGNAGLYDSERPEQKELRAYGPTGGVYEETVIIPTEGELEDVPTATELFGKKMLHEASYSVGEPIEGLSVNGADEYANEPGYASLKDGQKALYCDLLTQLKNFVNGTQFKTKDFDAKGQPYVSVFKMDKTISSYGITNSEGWLVYYMAFYNHPEFYWQSNYTYKGSDTITVLLNSFFSKRADREIAENAINAGISEYRAAVSGASSDYDKIKIVHDKLCSLVDYAYDEYNEPQSAAWAHSAAGAFYDYDVLQDPRGVVCEGYAKAFSLILNDLGIENWYVVGSAGGGGHAWNVVKVDGEYCPVDVTWDDLGNDATPSVFYKYYLVPESSFSQMHTPGSPTSSDWMLYNLPTLINDLEQTYFTHYGTNFIGNSNESDILSKLRGAVAQLQDNYIWVLYSSDTEQNIIKSICGKFSYYTTDMGKMAYIDRLKIKDVLKPITAISLDKTSASIDGDDENSLILNTSLTPSDTDDAVRWSVNVNGCATIQSSSNSSATFKFLKNGEYIISAKSAKNGVTATCTVTVSNITTMSGSKSGSPDKSVIWINGASVKDAATNDKFIYKVASWENEFEASDIVSYDSHGKQKTKKGKLIVGVTLSDTYPTLVKGKIVDAKAAEIAKASISKGTVKVSAKKKAGVVFVWVIDTGDAHEYSCTRITVKNAAGKINAFSDEALKTKFKSETLNIGESKTVYFTAPISSKDKNNANDCTFRYEVDEKYENLVTVSNVNAGDGVYAVRVTANGLSASKPGKQAKAKVTVYCVQSNKKATLSFTIINTPTDYQLTSDCENAAVEDDSAVIHAEEGAAVSASFKVGEILADDTFSATVKSKAYICSGESSVTTDSKGKVKVAKPSGDLKNVKLSYKDGTLTVSMKKFVKPQSFCICLTGTPGYGYKLFNVSIE